MVATVAGIHLSGTHAARPAGNAVPDGSLYSCSTHGLIYQSNYAGNSWATWATLGGTGMTDPMTTRGDIIVRDASNVTARLAVGSANKFLHSDGTDVAWAQVLPADLDVSADNTTANATSGHHGLLPKLSGSATDVLKGDGTFGAGGGGLTHSIIGYNTIGGSNEAGSNKLYAKSVTLAADALLVSIGVYTKSTNQGAVGSLAVGVWSDNAGVPKTLTAGSGFAANYLNLTDPSSTQVARWFEMPVGVWLTAATYWIGFEFPSNEGSQTIYYDASGSDHTCTRGANGSIDDWQASSDANSTKKYSIRATLLS